MPPLGSARERFSVKFYLVAMLFIIFDIETVFLIPWGTIYFGGATGSPGGPSMGFLLVEMLVFMFILAVGYVRSEEHTSELQSRLHLVCRLLLEKKKNTTMSTFLQPLTFF